MIKKTELVHHPVRKGEGVHVTTLRTSVTNSAGVSKSVLAFNLSSAQVPDRRYAADALRVEVGEDMVRIFFGQRKVPGDDLQSILLIRVSFLGARQFLASMEPILEKLQSHLTRFHIRSPSQLDIKEAPNQTVTLDANIVAAAYSSREACLDFYYVSPYVVLGMQKGGDMYADPVVRVIMTAANLMSMYRALVEKKASLPADEVEDQL